MGWMNPHGTCRALERSLDFVPSALCLAQRLIPISICLGLFGKWILRGREKGMAGDLLLELGSHGWAMLLGQHRAEKG